MEKQAGFILEYNVNDDYGKRKATEYHDTWQGAEDSIKEWRNSGVSKCISNYKIKEA